ncbi:MGMT family protein [Brachybacterium sp. AOP42-C2-15]|uniref:MGMT family protein n=1 Tax=Brachybacterium sp. AOP42-C2-15 TaxID=3457670 RepID=UPI004034F3FE
MEDPAAAVRAVALTIPSGSVMTYGEIAFATGLHPRQVGRIVGLISESIPWWRILRADGTPATCHGGTAPALLAKEHVPFRGNRVDLRALRQHHAAPPHPSQPPQPPQPPQHPS